MAVIDIRRSHKKPLKAAKTAVERVAKSIAKEHGIAHHWDGDTLVFDRSGVKGHIAVGKGDLHVRVELGFLMSALKPMIEREIERKLDEQLA
ncbi:polyhydroxyalkanoic acid system family protein [Dokdonella fugitiva]|jgi:putative polyhydroxyalkanoate system protein|uniref:Putative polyhydroxyalkanoate system protein n=1 Tax=Dokdonella fugitiva TaxID=328517 RepID=A0A4R2I9L1_9GAMM|nr:polyhydroxyalkanoic acid system family protein [Dokdonella fugitiva]MBA8883389.1 putative polyhydroxyalkanoate system protein [Dokdonella fugitiva]TCO40706.1 putative polyhydroxyalkanoate system protein [Dokdonella fugitiva]